MKANIKQAFDRNEILTWSEKAVSVNIYCLYIDEAVCFYCWTALLIDETKKWKWSGFKTDSPDDSSGVLPAENINIWSPAVWMKEVLSRTQFTCEQLANWWHEKWQMANVQCVWISQKKYIATSLCQIILTFVRDKAKFFCKLIFI